MNRFVRAFAVTLGLVIFGSVLSLMPQKTATATGGAPVTVLNTPLPVTGTVNAAVSGSIGVNNFPGNQSVSITNPSVPVSGSVGVTGTVSVANSSASPVPTFATDNPARNSYQAAFWSDPYFCQQSNGCANQVTLPTTNSTGQPLQRIVIQLVTVECNYPQTVAISNTVVGSRPFSSTGLFTHGFDAPKASSGIGSAVLQGPIYADPGSNLVLWSNAAFDCGVMISGYLVTQ